MDDPNRDIQIGTFIRGKDTELRGRVLKILDAGYLMILETEFDMEMNVHRSEIVVDTFATNPVHFKNPPKEKSISSKSGNTARLDLHIEKLPANYRNMPHPLEAQLLYLQDRFSLFLKQGIKEVQIIHGKGSGTLHQKIIQLLKSYPQIKELHPQKAALEKPHGVLVKLK